MPELTEAGAGLLNSLAGESPPAPTMDDKVAPVADEGPPVYGRESALVADPVDPETGNVLDLKPDESPLDLEAIYKTKLNVGDGETVTVSQLKDMYTELAGVKNKAIETDKARDDFFREQMVSRQEMDAMVALLPPQMQTDEFRAEARARIQKHVQAETVKILRIVPEWSDPQQADDDRRMILKHAARYGFNASEIGLISDHRMLKYFLDNARAERSLAGVEAKQHEQKAMNPTHKPGRRTKDQNIADIKTAAREGKLTKREAAGRVLKEALSRG